MKMTWSIVCSLIVCVVFQGGCMNREQRRNAISKAIEADDMNTLKSLVADDKEMLQIALALAGSHGKPKIAEKLLDMGADPKYGAGTYRAVLNSFVWKKENLEIIKLLIRKGADIKGGPVGKTRGPFCRALGVENLEIAQVLLDAGADIEQRAEGNRTPLHVQAILGNYKSVKFLVEHGANINALDKPNLTPLDHALTLRLENKEKIVNYLIAHGAKRATELKAAAQKK
ncbi:MAG: ankyrin repeat domain-containing protein [Lentisphaerae bacterium]|nr:MAG: ankyrin repeat domain-containing protein [Lentisphaerota bacterium]